MRLERRFLEIHPETPAEGRPVSELGYPPEQWARMMENLDRWIIEGAVPVKMLREVAKKISAGNTDRDRP